MTWLCVDCGPNNVKPSTNDKSVRSAKNNPNKMLKKSRFKRKSNIYVAEKEQIREGAKKKMKMCESERAKTKLHRYHM